MRLSVCSNFILNHTTMSEETTVEAVETPVEETPTVEPETAE
jgi:hypothetical protein